MLEVLVAFVILALVGTSLFRLFSGALANAAAADEYSRAVLVAETALAEAAAAQPLREGTQSGTSDDGRVAWTAQVKAYVAPATGQGAADQPTDALPIRLYRIVAEVSFPGPAGGTRTLTLATLRLAARDGGTP